MPLPKSISKTRVHVHEAVIFTDKVYPYSSHKNYITWKNCVGYILCVNIPALILIFFGTAIPTYSCNFHQWRLHATNHACIYCTTEAIEIKGTASAINR